MLVVTASSSSCGFPEITFTNILQYKLTQHAPMSGQAWMGAGGSQAMPTPVLLCVPPGDAVLYDSAER